MKRHFAGCRISCWIGPRLGLTSRSVCLQTDADGCDRLLLAIQEVDQEGPPAQRKLTLVPFRNDEELPRRIAVIRLILSPVTEPLQHMCVDARGAAVDVQLTPGYLIELRRCVELLKQGVSDFCLRPRPRKRRSRDLGELDRQSLELWFWSPTSSP